MRSSRWLNSSYALLRPSLRAKRSNPSRHSKKNGLLRCARNDGQTHVHGLAARCTRVLQETFRPKEGVGNAGCLLHPRPRVHLVLVERTRVTTSTLESPDIPARNGFNGFLRALGDRACLPPSPADMVLSKPGRADSTPPNLTPASGRQDHTTSPYATTSLVHSLLIAHKSFNSPCDPAARKTLPRPPHPIPTFVKR